MPAVTTRQIVDALVGTQDDLDDVLRATNGSTPLEEATRRIWATKPGQLGAQSLDGTRSPGYEWSPPKGSEDEWEHAKVWNQMHADAAQIRKLMDRLFRNVKAWQPHAATTKDRELSSLNGREEPGCEHCATIGKWERMEVESDAKGNLDRTYKLGWWCYRWALDTGTLPTRKQLEEHHDGRRVMRPA